MRTLFPFGLVGRTILLGLFWGAIAFSMALAASLAAGNGVPMSLVLVGPLSILAVLLGIYHAFHWNIPFGGDVWEELRRSPPIVQAVYGPVIVAGWCFGKIWLFLLMVLVFPILVPGFLHKRWSHYSLWRDLRKKGRGVTWNAVLPLAEQGKGCFLLETVWEEAGPSRENLSRLWWLPESGQETVLALPTYRQFLTGNIPWQTDQEAYRRVFNEYQHPQQGKGALVKLPWHFGKQIKRLLGTRVPETFVRVTWWNTDPTAGPIIPTVN